MSGMESEDQSLLEYLERAHYEHQELLKENERLRAALKSILRIASKYSDHDMTRIAALVKEALGEDA
jgi:hypothetical protein